MRLSDLATIKTNLPEADFWIIRKGSAQEVGRPVKDFSKERIGVLVEATDVVDPRYLYYAMMHLHSQGYWGQFDKGMTDLRHILVSDVKNVPVG